MVGLCRTKLLTSFDVSTMDTTDRVMEQTLREWNDSASFFISQENLMTNCQLQLALYYFPDHSLKLTEEKQDNQDNASSTSFFPRMLSDLAETQKSVKLATASVDLKYITLTKNKLDTKDLVNEDDEAELDPWKHKWIVLNVVDDEKAGKEDQAAVLMDFHRMACPRNRPEWPLGQVRVDVPHVGVSLINQTPEELAYISLHKFCFLLINSTANQALEVVLDHFQMDNQQASPYYPVIIGPTPVHEDVRQPFIQISLNKVKSGHPRLHTFQFFSFLMQALDVKVEERLIHQLSGLLKYLAEGTAQNNTEHHTMITRDLQLTGFEVNTQEEYYVCTLFQLQPVRINVSFETDPDLRQQQQQGLMGTLFRLGLNAIGNLDNVPVRLKGLLFHQMAGDRASLRSALVARYQTDVMTQLYKVIFSLDVLGNPVQVVGNLSQGMKDFFYEPAQGIVKSPGAFGAGLLKGTSSLVQNTFMGLFGAASSFTGGAGNAIAMLSVDQDYLSKRRKSGSRQANNVGEGVTAGVEAFGGGLLDGLTGVVMNPLRGARKSGAKGLAKGIASGMLGLVVKPTAGLMDLTSSTLRGISQTPTYLLNDKVVLTRVRMQRFIPQDNPRVILYTPKAEVKAPIEGQDLDENFAKSKCNGDYVRCKQGHICIRLEDGASEGKVCNLCNKHGQKSTPTWECENCSYVVCGSCLNYTPSARRRSFQLHRQSSSSSRKLRLSFSNDDSKDLASHRVRRSWSIGDSKNGMLFVMFVNQCHSYINESYVEPAVHSKSHIILCVIFLTSLVENV